MLASLLKLCPSFILSVDSSGTTTPFLPSRLGSTHLCIVLVESQFTFIRSIHKQIEVLQSCPAPHSFFSSHYVEREETNSELAIKMCIL